jgi:hypothetical protein
MFMTYAKSYVVTQKQKANELGWKKKAAVGLAVVALLFSLRPAGAIADVEDPDPSGTVQITKYDCPADMDFDNSLNSPAKPDANGDAVVPEGCVPAAGHKFGYIHEADRTDNSAPYAGRDDATPFSIAPGATDSNGVIILTDLLNGGRNDLVELDDSNSVVSDDGIFGFMCNEDTGTKSDNYDIIFNEAGKTSYCNVYNKVEEPTGVTLWADKVVCDTEADLPNWGDNGVQAGEPAVITASTAADYVDNSDGKCHLESDWSFQWGFAKKADAAGVNKLPGDHIGQADGTSTSGACDSNYCGDNTFTGSGYNDWKNFDTSTSDNGTISAAVTIDDLIGAPGIWVRENLQKGYVPFSYPPDGAPGSNVSAEMYCNDDIQNYDNYDEVINPVLGQTYYCVAFNALLDHDDNNDPCVSDEVATLKTEGEEKKFWFKGHEHDDAYVCKHVSGWKWQDMNGDGTWDPIDDNHGLAGWEFQAVDPVTHDVLATDFTDEDGYYEFNLPGDIQEIEIQEVTKPGWEITYPEAAFYLLDMSKGWNFEDNDFGNHLLDDNGGNGGSNKGSISGMVFEDVNDNGVFDEGDVSELGGWKVYLDSNNNGSFDDGEPTVTTASPYTFSNLDDGDYHVRVVLQDGWVLTAPVSGVYDVSISGANDVANQDFGVFDNGQGGDGNNGGSNNGSSTSRSSGSGTGNNPQVAGANTDNPQTPQVLGDTTLPRTGTPVWAFLAPLLAIVPLLVLRKKLS